MGRKSSVCVIVMTLGGLFSACSDAGEGSDATQRLGCPPGCEVTVLNGAEGFVTTDDPWMKIHYRHEGGHLKSVVALNAAEGFATRAPHGSRSPTAMRAPA